MGVPGFSTWFSRTACPQAFQDHRGKRFDHVFVDMASILHTVIRRARTVQQLHVQLYSELDKILLRCQPCKSVLLAMDGPAPLAKLLTQRSRRAAMSKRESRRRASGISSLGLTPGTQLMTDLENSLAFYVCQRLQTSWAHLHFELSGATVAGEGEVKIFGRMLNPWSPTNPDDSFAVVGSDSDLFLMALLRPAADNLWILPDSRDSKARRSPHGFSLQALDTVWGKLPQVTQAGSSQGAAERLGSLKADMAVVAILANGNDYLPGVLNTALESNSTGKGLWDVYLALRLLPKWQDRKLVVRGDSGVKLDHALLAALMDKYQKQSNFPAETKRDGWTLRKPPPDPANYLKALTWVLDMYCEGECSDFRYTYDAQTPSLTELKNFLESTETPPPPEAKPHQEADTGPLSPVVFAMALLPPMAGKEHAPSALRHLMDAGSPIADMYTLCSECEAHLEASKHARLRLTQALESLAAMDQETPASSRATRDAAASTVAVLRAQCRDIEDARFKHVLATHPYEGFPINRIERAVAAVPMQSFPDSERHLLGFGVSHAYWRQPDGEACCCERCQTGQASTGREPCAFQFPLPAAPTKALRKLLPEGLRRAAVQSQPETARQPARPRTAACLCPSCWSGATQGGPVQPLVVARSLGKRRRASAKRPAATKAGLLPGLLARSLPATGPANLPGGLGQHSLHTFSWRPRQTASSVALPYAALCLGQTAVSSLQQRSSSSAELEQQRMAGWEGSRARSLRPGWSGNPVLASAAASGSNLRSRMSVGGAFSKADAPQHRHSQARRRASEIARAGSRHLQKGYCQHVFLVVRQFCRF